MKYVIFDYDGIKFPVLFPADLIQHNWIKVDSKYGKCVPISAGTAQIFSKDEVYVSGSSLSLNIKSRPEDVEIIKKFLNNS